MDAGRPSKSGQVGALHNTKNASTADVALAFAIQAHGNQQYGGQPYAVHLNDVMGAAKRLGFGDEKFIVTAALHDVLEDTSVKDAELAQRFGQPVADAVRQLAHEPDVTTRDYLASMSDLAFSVKLADRLANIERLPSAGERTDHLVAKYVPEMGLFRAEAEKRGLQTAFQTLHAAMSSAVAELKKTLPTTSAAQVAVPSALLDQQSKKSGTSSGESFVTAMGGKLGIKPGSLSPMFAVRSASGPVRGAAPAMTALMQRVDDLYKAADWKGLAAALDENRPLLDGFSKAAQQGHVAPPDVERARVMHEKILVGLNKSKQFLRTLDEASVALRFLAPKGVESPKLEGLEALSLDNRKELGEIYGAIGKAFREIANGAEKAPLDGATVAVLEKHVGHSLTQAPPGELRRHAQELSTKFYEASFFSNRSHYGAVNAAHDNLRLGNVARAERFAWMADASMKDGGHGSADYWAASTKLEVAILTNDPKKVPALFAAAASQVTQSWEAETTARTLEDTARIFRRDAGGTPQDLAILDAVCGKLRELEKSPELAKDTAWLAQAQKDLGGGAAATASSRDAANAPALPEQYGKVSTEIFKSTVDLDWRHQSVDLNALYQQAEVAKGALDKLLDTLVVETGGKALKAPLKGRPRAEQKIQDFAGDASQLVDIARASLEVASVDAVYQALGKLHERAEIVGIKDRFQQPYGSGYRDVLLKVRFPEADGHVAELQLHLAGILTVKNGPGHALYEEQRNHWTNAAKEGRALNEHEKQEVTRLDGAMKKLYDDAYRTGL